MPRKTKSDVYQVDLVAALFGGFMIAWLSTAEEVQFSHAGATPPGYATVEAFTSFERDVTQRVWYKVADSGILNVSCLSSEEVKVMFGEREQLLGCPSKIVQHPKQGGIETGKFHERNLLGSLEEPCAIKAEISENRLVESFNSSLVLNLGIDELLSPAGITIERLEESDFWENKLKIENHFFKWNEISPFAGKRNCVAKYDPGSTVGVFSVNNLSEIISIDHFSLTIDSNSHSVLNLIKLKGGVGYKRHLSRVYSGFFHRHNPILSLRICVFHEAKPTCFHGETALMGSNSITLSRVDI